MVACSATTTSIEEIASAASDGVRWLQIFPFKEQSLMLPAIQMAESRGYSAIAVTIDNGSGVQQAAGINFESDFRAKFHIPEHLKLPFIETIVSSYDSSIQDRKKWFYQ